MWGFDAVLDDDESFAADVAADVGGTPDAAAGPAADDDAAAKAKVTDDDEFRKVESTQVLRGGSSRETISFIKKIEQEKKTRANTGHVVLVSTSKPPKMKRCNGLSDGGKEVLIRTKRKIRMKMETDSKFRKLVWFCIA